MDKPGRNRQDRRPTSETDNAIVMNLGLPVAFAEVLLALIAAAGCTRLARLFLMARVHVFAGAMGDILPRVRHANRIALSLGAILLLAATFLMRPWQDDLSMNIIRSLLTIFCTYFGLRIAFPALAKQRHMRHNDEHLANEPVLVADRLALALVIAAIWLAQELLPFLTQASYQMNDAELMSILVGVPVWLYCCGIIEPDRPGWMKAEAAQDYFDLFSYNRRGITGWVVILAVTGFFAIPAIEWLSPAASRAAPWLRVSLPSFALTSMVALVAGIGVNPENHPTSGKRLLTPLVVSCGLMFSIAGYLWSHPSQSMLSMEVLAGVIVGSGLGIIYGKAGLQAFLDRRQRRSRSLLTSTSFGKGLLIILALYLIYSVRGNGLQHVIAIGVALHFFLVCRLLQRSTAR